MRFAESIMQNLCVGVSRCSLPTANDDDAEI
jgi:hypothetical protein